ncbi:MAG: GNAT family N-acetyltransferase [Rhodospirillales bacterium]|nr:GNAT family N-acetyltransferase [Rhodospirillales bacterium]
MLKWTDDDEVTHYMYRGWRPSRLDELEKDFETTVNSDKDIEFAVCAQDDGRHIGVAGLHEIDWLTRNTEYRIMIGDKTAWGKGYGQETTALVVKYAFEKLNMNRVGLGVNAQDARAVKSYKKSGFVKEGVLRQVVFRNSAYYDAICMSILRSEYEDSKK